MAYNQEKKDLETEAISSSPPHGVDSIEKQTDSKDPIKDPNSVIDAETGYSNKAILKHSDDADEAMKVFADLGDQPIVLTEETNKRLLKIIDWHLMPLMCVVYGLNYLDSMGFHSSSILKCMPISDGRLT